jgi:hypothetical protein
MLLWRKSARAPVLWITVKNRMDFIETGAFTINLHGRHGHCPRRRLWPFTTDQRGLQCQLAA